MVDSVCKDILAEAKEKVRRKTVRRRTIFFIEVILKGTGIKIKGRRKRP